MVFDLNWYHDSQSHQITCIFYYISKLTTRQDQLGGKRLHGFRTSSVSRSVCMWQRRPRNAQEWQRSLTVVQNMQQHRQVQNMLGQKVLQVHQINCRSRQKPQHQCKQVSNPIPINWLTFHLALQTRMLSRHKCFKPLFQQIQHSNYLRTLKCRSFFASFRQWHCQFCHLGCLLGGNCWNTTCGGEVVEDSQGAICWPCVSHCLGHWSITELWHSADGCKGTTKEILTVSVLLSFSCDFATPYFALFCDWIFELQLLSQFLMDFP